MSNAIYLRRDRDLPDWLVWCYTGPDGSVVQDHGNAEDAAPLCSGRRVIFLAPAEAVLLARVKVPGRNRQRILQALPYMLEDRLVQDIEQLHFAIGAREADGALNVAVVERAVLDRWLEHLRSAGIEPAAVVPETLALPWETGGWALVCDGGLCLLRTGPQSGQAIDNENVPAVLAQAISEAGDARPAWLSLHTADSGPSEESLAGTGLEIRTVPTPQDPLLLMAQHLDERNTIDLLQGEYNRSEQFGRLLRPWLASAAVLVVLAILHSGLLIQQHMALTAEAERLQQSIEQTYLEAFPEAQRVVNPRVQMERGLDALRRGGSGDAGSFLDMLHGAAPALKQTRGLVIQRMNYREGRLDLALTLGDLQDLDRLKQQLGENGRLAVEIQSASAQAERIEARIQLRASP